jgi:hypothetical protein
LRAWHCPRCQALFHTIEGPLTAGGALRVIDERQAAAILGKSALTLRNERVQGRSRVPFVRQGRRIGYLLSDLAEYIMAHRVMPGGKDGMP